MTTDARRGARLEAAQPLPTLNIAPLIRKCLENTSGWIHTANKTVVVDLALLLDPISGGVRPSDDARNDSVVVGGSVPNAEEATTAAATRALRARVEAMLDDSGAQHPNPEAPPATPETLNLRIQRDAQLAPHNGVRKTRALVVLSTEESFPDRVALCDVLEKSFSKHLPLDVAARFAEHLPWQSDADRDRRSTIRAGLEGFVRFVQEYGMARVRLRVAFQWMRELAGTISAPELRDPALRYAEALQRIILAAESGSFEEATIESLGTIYPLGWARKEFANTLPLFPRSDCEIASEADEEVGRRGHEKTEGVRDARGRPAQCVVRHVTYLPRFNATGLTPVKDSSTSRYETTLESRHGMLSRARGAGVFSGRSNDSERATQLLRALEHHIVVRAAIRFAYENSEDPVEELRVVLGLLGSPEPGARGKAIDRIIDGYRGAQDGVHQRLEAISNALAQCAGQLAPVKRHLTYSIVFDPAIFAPSERTPFIDSGMSGTKHPYRWMRQVRVKEGTVAASAAFQLTAEVTLETLAMTWLQPIKNEPIQRGVPNPLRVILAHPVKDERRRKQLNSLVCGVLGDQRPDLLIRVPYCVDPEAEFSSTIPFSRGAELSRAAGACVVGSVVLSAWLARVDPTQSRSVELITLFDAQPTIRDSGSDAILRAVSRSLDTNFGLRPVISQGIAASTKEGHSRYQKQGVQSALKSLGDLQMDQTSAHESVVGILVLAGRPVDCVLSQSGRPDEALSGRDLLWGSAYIAQRSRGRQSFRRVAHIADVANLGDPWPAAVSQALAKFAQEGCRLVVLVTHRAFERRTFRAESRNRFYDGEVPLHLLSALPDNKGMRFVSVLCDRLTAISANPDEGTNPADSMLILADPSKLTTTRSYSGLRPIVAVATNRSVKRFEADPRGGATRRVGLRRRVFVYLERGTSADGLTDLDRKEVMDSLVGLHLLEAESISTKDQQSILTPVLSPHRVFDVERLPDAGELTWKLDHLLARINLVALSSVTRSFLEARHA